MPRKIGLFLALLLVVSFCRCRNRPAEVCLPPPEKHTNIPTPTPLQDIPLRTHIEFLDGEQAGRWISTDTIEGYFDKLGQYDMQLQMGHADSAFVAMEDFRRYLARLPISWPPTLKEKMRLLYQRALRECEYQLPGLAPDTIRLALTPDQPYGPRIYFTRNMAVFSPRSDLRQNSDDQLLAIARHELFHLISRRYCEHRSEWYALAGFEAVADSIQWPDHLYRRRLANPDAPRSDYALKVDDERYLPLLYATQAPWQAEDPNRFGAALRFSYYRLSSDGRLSGPVLSNGDAATYTGGLTDYLLHPEEILAEWFAKLLKQGCPGEEAVLLAFKDALQQLTE